MQPPCSAHGHAEEEAEADERSRQEGYVEAAEGVLGEAERHSTADILGVPTPERTRSSA